MKAPARVLLALGGNQGDRLGHLQAAVDALQDHPRLAVARISPVFETEFIGDGRQDPYLNACLELRCGLEPLPLLDVLKELEEKRGRRPDTHLQPRPLDLDILLFGERIVDEERLAVPHPRLRERAFVLEPLARIAGDLIFPDSGETVAQACAKIRGEPDGRVLLRQDLELRLRTGD